MVDRLPLILCVLALGVGLTAASTGAAALQVAHTPQQERSPTVYELVRSGLGDVDLSMPALTSAPGWRISLYPTPDE